MEPQDLKAWRTNARDQLIERRLSVGAEQRARWSRSIRRYLEQLLTEASWRTIGFCWPHRGEYDARPIVLDCLERGARAALPIVVAPRQPLVFCEWSPKTKMSVGVYDIPIPVDSPQVTPDIVLIPLAGFDDLGYRLGYGAGFFDRTLASWGERRAKAIGIGFELARIPTIHPQWHDIAMDYVVTELGAYRRGPTGLVPEARAAQNTAG